MINTLIPHTMIRSDLTWPPGDAAGLRMNYSTFIMLNYIILCLYIYLSIYLPISLYLSIYLSIYLSLSIYIYIYMYNTYKHICIYSCL